MTFDESLIPQAIRQRNAQPLTECTLTALQWLIAIHSFGAGRFWSMEKPKEPASNSELRRWIEKGCLQINDEIVGVKDILDYPFHSVVLFPKNPKRRITLL
jgi:hypothetical protein